jgi:3-hydroxyisobutyrate dehydrogenase-like beta-hydroxyacid dehydrogenase
MALPWPSSEDLLAPLVSPCCIRRSMSYARKPRTHVGVIGLGIIGSRVAAALRHHGYQAFVWNRTPRSAPNFLGSPGEVARSCETIQLFVADAAATLDVIEQMREELTPNHVVLSHGTIGLDGTLRAAELVRQTGAEFLDAPFTGSKGAAENRQLVYYIGGTGQVLDRVRPALEASAKEILHLGEVGHAAIIKVATNLISAATVQVLAEALALTVKAGVRPEALGEAIAGNAMRSGVTDLKLPKMLSGDFEPHFSLKHMFKDVQLGVKQANELNLDLPATSTIAGLLNSGLSQGWGDLDYAALAKRFGFPEGGASA